MKITLLTGKTFDFSKDYDFKLNINKSALAKRLILRINEKEHAVDLTIPKHCSAKQAKAFIDKYCDWIKNKLALIPVSQKFISGSKFIFFGQEYIVNHSPDIIGTTFKNSVLNIGGKPEFLHRRVCDFLKEQTLNKLSALSIQKAKILNCHIASIVLKDTKSRWGSCSTLHNINYNWRICFAPLEVIDYLVSHEVSHLIHQDHSKEFWQTVESICPDCKTHRLWLKKHGKELYIWQ